MVALIKIVFIHHLNQKIPTELLTLQQVMDKEDMIPCS